MTFGAPFKLGRDSIFDDPRTQQLALQQQQMALQNVGVATRNQRKEFPVVNIEEPDYLHHQKCRIPRHLIINLLKWLDKHLEGNYFVEQVMDEGSIVLGLRIDPSYVYVIMSFELESDWTLFKFRYLVKD